VAGDSSEDHAGGNHEDGVVVLGEGLDEQGDEFLASGLAFCGGFQPWVNSARSLSASVSCCPSSAVRCLLSAQNYIFSIKRTNKSTPNYSQMILKMAISAGNTPQMISKMAISTRDRRFQNHLGLSRPGTATFQKVFVERRK